VADDVCPSEVGYDLVSGLNLGGRRAHRSGADRSGIREGYIRRKLASTNSGEPVHLSRMKLKYGGDRVDQGDRPEETVADLEGRRRRGRPPKFDREIALREAMKLFWEHRFEGTSTDELEAALGMGPSSILNSFGSKEQLYELPIETYMGEPTRYFQEMLDEAIDASTAFENLIEAAARELTRADSPAGCMISLAGTRMSRQHESIRIFLAEQRALSKKLLAERIKRRVSDGDLPEGTNVEELASYFRTVIRGMAVQARDGRSRADLQAMLASRCEHGRPSC